jgi:hypothetical protein
MSATTYSVYETDLKQGNVKVARDSYIRTVVYLYVNPILTHVKQETPNGTMEHVRLDDCGKATLTTQRAMNRGLRQFGFPGEVELDPKGAMEDGHTVPLLSYTNPFGISTPIIDPISVSKHGETYAG